jgi:hypothetical protein
MHIRVQFELTPDDYVDYMKAYVRHRRSLTPRDARGLRSPAVVAWAIVAMLAGWCVLESLVFPPPSAPAATSPAAPTPLHDILWSLTPYLIVMLMIWAVFFWSRSGFLYRRMASQATRLGQPRAAEITDTHIKIEEASSTTIQQWTYFIRCIETPRSFLLFQLPRLAHIVPKRAFGAQELAEFRAFSQAHVGRASSGFPIQPAAGGEPR